MKKWGECLNCLPLPKKTNLRKYQDSSIVYLHWICAFLCAYALETTLNIFQASLRLINLGSHSTLNLRLMTRCLLQCWKHNCGPRAGTHSAWLTPWFLLQRLACFLQCWSHNDLRPNKNHRDQGNHTLEMPHEGHFLWLWWQSGGVVLFRVTLSPSAVPTLQSESACQWAPTWVSPFQIFIYF